MVLVTLAHFNIQLLSLVQSINRPFTAGNVSLVNLLVLSHPVIAHSICNHDLVIFIKRGGWWSEHYWLQYFDIKLKIKALLE